MEKNKSTKKLKGAEEIRSELEALKVEVEDKKNELEKESSDFIADLDATVADIEQQIEQKVSQINVRKNEIESEVKQKLIKALDSGKKFLSIFKNNQKVIISYFQGILLASYFLLVSLIILLFPQNVVRIPLAIIFAFIFAAFYHKLKKITKLNSENMENSLKPFGTSPSLSDFEAPKISYKEKKSRLDNLQKVLGGVIASISKIIPGVDKAYVELVLLAKFQKKVKEFESTLEYYNIRLTSNPSFFDDLGKFAPAEARIIDDESLWEEMIVKKIISEIKHDQPNVSSDVIYLLYKEHNGQDTLSLFRKMKENSNEKELRNLANILLNSGRLTKAPGDLSYDVEDVFALLKSVEDFDLSRINNLLSSALRKLDFIQSYRDFLEKNKIRVNIKPTVKYVLENVADGTDSFESQVINLAYKFGLACYKDLLPSEEIADGFARASVSIKFNTEISLRRLACGISSTYTSVAVIRAYQEKRKQRGGEFVTLNDLVNDLGLITSFIKNKDDIDFRFLASELKEGKWYDSTSDYLKVMIEDMKKELKTQMDKVEKFTILKEAVRKTFEEVKIDTIEKAIDAQVFSAYLIMSSSSHGELARLIDLLSLRSLDKPKEERWTRKDRGTIEQIKKQYGVTPRYDFMKFSNSSWVGILERGKQFTDFKNSFLNDLKKVLEKEEQHFNIGLVLQRITPSKYSFGILEDVPENVNIKDLEIARYVARLARDHIPEEEQASVMMFDKDVDMLKILDTKSIYELIRVENDDINHEEKKILERSSLKKEVLNGLQTELRTLAKDLAKNVISEDNVLHVVSNIFAKNKLKRANVFSKRFVNVLKELAVLYEIQRK